MKIYTVNDIRDLNPCYDPTDKVPEGTTGTLLDILKLENVPCEDRLWIVTKFLDDKINRLFAVWCTRETLKIADDIEQRSIDVCDIAEKFAYGNATQEELAAASNAASNAASDAARAASDAARAAASDAAWAAWDAWDAAMGAAGVAASNAAWDAWDAARVAASDAAWDAAMGATRDAQIKQLIKMLEE